MHGMSADLEMQYHVDRDDPDCVALLLGGTPQSAAAGTMREMSLWARTLRNLPQLANTRACIIHCNSGSTLGFGLRNLLSLYPLSALRSDRRVWISSISRARSSRRRHVVPLWKEQAEGWAGYGQEYKGFTGEVTRSGWTDAEGEHALSQQESMYAAEE